MIQQQEIYVISHYQRGCYFVFTTESADVLKKVNEYKDDHKSKFIHLFPYLCAKCIIRHVTPHEKTHLKQLEIYK